MTYIVMAISYTVWNMSLILSHPPTLLGQCPKFDRIYFLMASLTRGRYHYAEVKMHTFYA